VNGTAFSGMARTNINIKDAPIEVDLLEPKKSSFAVGESVTFKVRLTYPDGTPVDLPSINATVGGKEVTLRSVENGVFQYQEVVTEEHARGLAFSTKLEDDAGNAGAADITVDVEGEAMTHVISRNRDTLLRNGVAVLILLALVARYMRHRTARGDLEGRWFELMVLQEKLQKDYFKHGSIDKESFDELDEQYHSEMAEVAKKLESMGVAVEGEAEPSSKKESEAESPKVEKVSPYEAQERRKRAGLKKRLDNLTIKLETVQEDYFVNGSIEREEFDKLNEKYEAQIRDAKKELAVLGSAKKVDDALSSSPRTKKAAAPKRAPVDGHRAAIKRAALEKRRDDLYDRMKRIQEDYYENDAIDKETYEKRSTRIEKELKPIERQLEELEPSPEEDAPDEE
jgi:hypothetical protein